MRGSRGARSLDETGRGGDGEGSYGDVPTMEAPWSFGCARRSPRGAARHAIAGPGNAARQAVGGGFTLMRGVTRSYLGALTTSGTLLPWDPGANDTVRAITSVSTGDIVVRGFFTEVGGQAIDHIDALDLITGGSNSWSYPSSARWSRSSPARTTTCTAPSRGPGASCVRGPTTGSCDGRC